MKLYTIDVTSSQASRILEEMLDRDTIQILDLEDEAIVRAIHVDQDRQQFLQREPERNFEFAVSEELFKSQYFWGEHFPHDWKEGFEEFGEFDETAAEKIFEGAKTHSNAEVFISESSRDEVFKIMGLERTKKLDARKVLEAINAAAPALERYTGSWDVNGAVWEEIRTVLPWESTEWRIKTAIYKPIRAAAERLVAEAEKAVIGKIGNPEKEEKGEEVC